jgi:hypothetical protein
VLSNDEYLKKWIQFLGLAAHELGKRAMKISALLNLICGSDAGYRCVVNSFRTEPDAMVIIGGWLEGARSSSCLRVGRIGTEKRFRIITSYRQLIRNSYLVGGGEHQLQQGAVRIGRKNVFGVDPFTNVRADSRRKSKVNGMVGQTNSGAITVGYRVSGRAISRGNSRERCFHCLKSY